jgi:lysine/ornithine N-monooxygenase
LKNDDKEKFDAIIFCTGYKIDLTILHDDLKKLVFDDEDKGVLNV